MEPARNTCREVGEAIALIAAPKVIGTEIAHPKLELSLPDTSTRSVTV